MAAIAQPFLHENLIEGVDTTAPAHLIGNKWRTQHNMRLTPMLRQVPHKKVIQTIGGSDINFLGVHQSDLQGNGRLIAMTPTAVFDLQGNTWATGLHDDGTFKRWSVINYNNSLYYCNDNNPIRVNNGSSDTGIANSPAARYLVEWFDHLVVAVPSVNGQKLITRLQLSHLYDFTQWTPRQENEADFFDFEEWQQVDYPGHGITGIGELRSTLWVYMPNGIVPVRYVGKPKVIQVQAEGELTRVGNTFPWTLVCMDNVHFFYDAREAMFFAFEGQAPQPIGEPVRQFMLDNLNADAAIASSMYAYVDIDNREIWWCFVSNESSGTTFDKAVVFNYRYRRWFTASVENVKSFVSSIRDVGTVGGLLGIVSALTGTVGQLGTSAKTPRLFGSSAGRLLREEVTSDSAVSLLPADDPILESGDFHYGDIKTVKENSEMLINAFWDETLCPEGKIELRAQGRSFLSTDVDWSTVDAERDPWKPSSVDEKLTYPAVSGRVLRYQFRGKNVRNMLFSAYSDVVRAKGAEK